MFKILILCDSGVSSNAFLDLMRKAASELDVNCEIKPGAISEVFELVKDVDLVLLSPQVRYNLNKIEKLVPSVKVKVISVEDFSLLNTHKIMNEIKVSYFKKG